MLSLTRPKETSERNAYQKQVMKTRDYGCGGLWRQMSGEV